VKPEAHEDANGDIYFMSWFRWSVGIILTMILAANAYVYSQVLPLMTSNIITNDKESRERDIKLTDDLSSMKIKIERFGVLEQKIDSLGDDMKEIKSILRRTSPYERNSK